MFGAAAGAIGTALLGWPPLVGTLCLIACISFVTAYGTASVERLFKWVSIFLYARVCDFRGAVVLRLRRSHPRESGDAAPHDGWVLGGFTYAGYNVVGAVIILPVLRHLRAARMR